MLLFFYGVVKVSTVYYFDLIASGFANLISKQFKLTDNNYNTNALAFA